MTKDLNADLIKKLQLENEELRLRLEESQSTLNALRNIKEDSFTETGVDFSNMISSSLSETSAQTFFEKMNEGAFILSPQGRIMFCNSYFARLMNMEIEKVIGSKLEFFISQSSLTKIERLLKNRQAWPDNLNILFQPNGHAQPIQLRLTPNTFNANDHNSELGIIATDVSAYKLIEDELREAHDTLEKRVAERTANLARANEELVKARIATLRDRKSVV